MEFRILGPLEVRSRAGVVPLPRRRERVLLAALLLHPGEVVSTDRLIDAIWGETAPRTAMGSLQNAVASLRKTLGADVLRTQAPGYALDVDPGSIDAVRFERLLEEAMRIDVVASRSELLGSALALWRGPALADLADEPAFRAEAARLDELRLVAVEERIDADLDLGRDAELIPELEAHVAAHPLRERVTRQLMLALYRAGRQAESLEAYQRARRALDEVGIPPSPELQDLERRILRQDPTLLLPKDSPTGAATVVALEAARKTVTILAATLAAAEGLDPEALRPLLDTWFATIREVVGRHGGTLDRYLGTDAVAVFGVPSAHEDDALRAVRAAIDLREEYGDETPAPRTGIATGEALVGVGTAPVVGDVVAVACALRDGARAGALLVSDATLELVRDAVSTGKRREVVQGGRTLTVVEVVAAQGAYGRRRRLDAPLVGRDPALEKLRDALGRATSEGRCVAVAVIGEAGIGKTRLARELIATVPHAHVLTGACAPYGEDTSYGPVLDLVRQAAGDASAQAIESLLDPADDRAARDLASIATDAPASRGDVFLAVRALLISLAARRPVVVVLDDVHWADTTLLDLVEYLADRVAGSVLVVCLARPELLESRPEWAAGAGQITLGRLGPLTPEAATAAVEAMPDEVDDAIVQRIVARAAGNPLHLEQLQAYAAEGGDPEAVPATIEAVLAQRLDRLDRAQLDVLRRSAVLGESLTRDGVLALADDREAVDPALLALVRRGLLHSEPSAIVDDGYAFHHALLRDVAYGGLTKEARARLHAQAAAWVDRDGDGIDEIVGYHLEQAYGYSAELGVGTDELAATAGNRLARAGWRDLRGNNLTTAVGLYERALALLPDGEPGRARAACEFAVALRTQGRDDDARAVLGAALRDAEVLGDEAVVQRVLLEQASGGLDAGLASSSELEAVARRAIAVFEAAGDDRALARAHGTLGQAAFFTARYAVAAEESDRALEFYARAEMSAARPISAAASSHLWGPTPVDEARERCLAYLESPVDRTTEANVRSALGALHGLAGDFDLAWEHTFRAVAIWEGLEFARALAEVSTQREILISQLEGDLSRALLLGRRWLAHYADRAAPAWIATAAAKLAWIVLEQGDVDEAEALVRRAEAAVHREDAAIQSAIGAVRSRVLIRRDRHAEALASARDGIGALDGTDAALDLAIAWAALAEVQGLAGDDARSSIDRVERYCLEKQAPALRRALSGLLAS